MANDITKQLAKFKKKVEANAKRGVKEFVELQYTQATSRVPVDSGELRNSIDKQHAGYTGQVTVSALHAFYLEWGTGIYATGTGGSRAKKIPWVYEKDGKFYRTYGQPAQPYWYPSLHISRDFFYSYFDRK